MEHQIIIKCRVCLGEFKELEMFELFKEDKNCDIKLYERVEFCCGIRIRESAELPNTICPNCHEITKIWFNFRRLCFNTQLYLESFCNDRLNKSEISSNNTNYLIEDLQSFRATARKNNASLTKISNPTYLSEDDDAIIKSVETESVSEINDIEDNEKDDKTSKKVEKSVQKSTIAKKTMKSSSTNSSYMCSVCGNVYNKKTAFKYHMTVHSNIRPHECEICGKKFRQVSELKNHMRRHTGEKPYKCNFCDRHFIDRSEKHRHEMVHTDVRPYVCKVCGKSFQYAAILKNHSKLHSGERQFNCLVCQKSFTLQHQLKAHLQTMVHKQKESNLGEDGYEIIYE